MNRTATVRPNQTLADLAIEHCGHLAAWPEIARLNGLGLTASVAAGQLLKMPEVVDARAVKILREGGWHPAVFVDLPLDGIGFWGIEDDFIVQ